MFDVFDSGSDHGQVYRALVVAPRSGVAELQRRTSLPTERVHRALELLRQLDAVVVVDPDTWDARRPDLVVAALLRGIDESRTRMRDAESPLTEAFRYARFETVGDVDIEVLRGPDIFDRFRRIQQSARRHVWSVDRPPYYWDEAEIVRQENIQSEQMATGIEYRTIYQESEGDSPIRNAGMARTVAAGESARVLARPALKMTIVDSEVALLPLDPPPGAEGVLATLLVHHSALLNVLCKVFESLWSFAVPVNLDTLNHEISPREREILTLMAAGAGDDAIARRLGVSRRTIVRHIGRLLEHLGATTRFQAGAQAARRGWL